MNEKSTWNQNQVSPIYSHPQKYNGKGNWGGTTDVSISLFQKSLNYNYSPKYS